MSKTNLSRILLGFLLAFGSSGVSKPQDAMEDAMNLVKNRDFVAAAPLLFQLSRRTELQAYKGSIHLTLGRVLLELKMPQVAAWQFVNVITLNDVKNYKKAVELLIVAADELGDRTILNYALSKIKINDFPEDLQEMLDFRLGEVKFEAKDYKGAIQDFEKVPEGHKYYEKAQYDIAMSYAFLNDTDSAIEKFNHIITIKGRTQIHNEWRVAALLGLARVYYQKKDWQRSLYFYRSIPRDNEAWHDALFESSWAELRGGKLRSTLGSFQSLHSDFYKDFYYPESLVLRAILYLYICKYDEIQKVVELYENSYGNIYNILNKFLTNKVDPMVYYNEIEKALRIKKNIIFEKEYVEGELPYSVSRFLENRGNISNGLEYLRKLYEEKKRLGAMSYSFSGSSLARYANQIIQKRIQNTKLLIGVKAKGHMLVMRAELKDLNEQIGFLKYELINQEKEKIQKKIISGGRDSQQIDSATDRDSYVKNGYDYYPFRGEYWLDEIGNFFYLGKTSCDENR